MDPIAHTGIDGGPDQGFEEHLRAVARIAASNAPPGYGSAAEVTGWLHDLGKIRAPFQGYLEAAKQGRALPSTDHKFAGAWTALSAELPCGLAIARAIAGHHGGLEDQSPYMDWFTARYNEQAGEKDLFEKTHASLAVPAVGSLSRDLEDETARAFPLRHEMATRLLYSTLVDADSLDTEQFYDERAALLRERTGDLEPMARAYISAHDRVIADAVESPLRTPRRRFVAEALEHAAASTGAFGLAMPTGAGKTMTGLRFAFEHALAHGLHRVIVVVPYLTITEQTAAVYREMLGDEAVGLLEHHSGVDLLAGDDRWRRLTSETWDAPLVLTTMVQLVNVLGGNRPSTARRLHRLAESVIVLDEVQTLPMRLVTPVFDMLGFLAETCRTSVVLSTATQPALERIVDEQNSFASIQQLTPEALVEDPVWQRVEYMWPTESVEWPVVAEEIAADRQALCIVNSRVDAQNLYDLLQPRVPKDHLYHLSTRMCREHRLEVLGIVRSRLSTAEPVILVSTQLVEAGVDLDFPVVRRAMAPLDSIVQAAGRCNREGRRASGVVHVFEPADQSMPPGAYSIAADTAARHIRRLLSEGDCPASPRGLQRYFETLVDEKRIQLDGIITRGASNERPRTIQDHRRTFDYKRVAAAMRVIEEDTKDVVVPYGVLDLDAITGLRRRWKSEGVYERRVLQRRLASNVVSLSPYHYEQFLGSGFLDAEEETFDVWIGEYHPQLGLQTRIGSAVDLIL